MIKEHEAPIEEWPYLRYYKTDALYHGMVAYLDGAETQAFSRYSTLEEVAEMLMNEEYVPAGELGKLKAKINGPTQHDIDVHLDRGEGKAVPLEPGEEKRFLSMLGLK